MDAADLGEEGGRPETFGQPGPRRPADRAFGSTGFFAAYLELVGSRATDPEEAGQVVERLEAAPTRPLSEPDAPRRPGLYALYLQNRARPVYVGKAGGQRGVQGRLADHLETLRLHRNIDPSHVHCRYILYSRRAARASRGRPDSALPPGVEPARRLRQRTVAQGAAADRELGRAVPAQA